MTQPFAFAFEGLDVYRLSLEVARWFRTVDWPEGAAHRLRDNAVRAADSVVLNIAEGRMRGGKAGLNHYRIALGSAGEALAVLDVVDIELGPAQQDKLRRVGAMLAKMS